MRLAKSVWSRFLDRIARRLALVARYRRARRRLSRRIRWTQLRLRPFEERVVPAVITWIGTADGNWNTAANWDLNRVPGSQPGDDVVIPDIGSNGADLTISHTSGTATVNSLTAAENFSLTGGSLTLAGLSTPENLTGASVLNAGFNLSVVTLTTNRLLTLAGTTTWAGGGFAGAGMVTNSGSLHIAGNVVMGSTPLTNTGSVMQTGGITLNSSTIHNQLGGTWVFNADVGLSNNTGVSTFNNSGTVRKQVGTLPSVSAFLGSVSFNNLGGFIDVVQGELRLRGGTSTGGTIQVAGGATLDLVGGATQTVTGLWTDLDAPGGPDGTIVVRSGSSVAVGSAGATFEFNDATFTMDGGGSLGSPGTTLVNRANITLNAAANAIVLGGILTNRGTITQTGTNLLRGSSATISNERGAVYDLAGDGDFGTVSGVFTINDAGTFRKSAGAGTSAMGDINNVVNFNNRAGTIDVQGGTLSLRGGTSTGGTYTVAGGAVLALTTTQTWTGTHTGTGAGAIRHAGGGAIINIGTGGATFNFAGALFEWREGAILTGGNLLTVAPGSQLNLVGATGGSLGGSGVSFSNLGSIVHTGTGNWTLSIPITNQTGGLIDLQNTGGFAGASRVDNFGTFRKSVGTGTATMTAELLNQLAGTVEVAAGTLNLTHVNNNTATTMPNGTWKVTNNATLNFPAAGAAIATIGTQAFVTLDGSGSGINKLLSNSLTSVAGGLTLLNAASLTTGANLSVSGSLTLGRGALIQVQSGGSYTQTNLGTLTVEIGGTTTGDHGRVATTGAVTLNGTLSTRLVNGYFPTPGDSFVVMTGTSVTGTYATTNLQGISGVYFSPTYGPASVTLNAAATATATFTPTVETTTGSNKYLWSNPANWAGGVLPTLAHDVDTGSGTEVILFDNTVPAANRVVNSLIAARPVEISTTSGIALTVNAGSSFTDLTLTGFLAGPGDVTVSGTLAWSGQTMTGSGTTTVRSGGTLSITGSVTADRAIVNGGTATWTAGTISGTGSITNTGTFNAQANAACNVPFTNTGTLNRSGAGLTGFGAAFTSSGPVNVTAGTLDFTGTGSRVLGSGPFAVDAGATLRVGNTTHLVYFDAASAITGDGTFAFTGGTSVFVAGGYTVPSTSLSGGGARTLAFVQPNSTTVNLTSFTLDNSVLAGSADLRVPGGATFSVPAFASLKANRLVVEAGGTLTLSGSSTKELFGTLLNAGTVTWSGGQVQEAGTFINQSGGVFNAQASNLFIPAVTNEAGGTIVGDSSGTATFGGAMTSAGGDQRQLRHPDPEQRGHLLRVVRRDRRDPDVLERYPRPDRHVEHRPADGPLQCRHDHGGRDRQRNRDDHGRDGRHVQPGCHPDRPGQPGRDRRDDHVQQRRDDHPGDVLPVGRDRAGE